MDEIVIDLSNTPITEKYKKRYFMEHRTLSTKDPHTS